MTSRQGDGHAKRDTQCYIHIGNICGLIGDGWMVKKRELFMDVINERFLRITCI